MRQANRPLKTILTRRILTFVGLTLLVLDVLVGVTAHHLIHQQTDAMLLELAHAEARLGQFRHGEVASLPSSIVALPGWQREPARKYAIAYDRSCQLLGQTGELGELDVAPAVLCSPDRPIDQRVLFISFGELELRAATISSQTAGGEPIGVMVGVNHEHIDRATWLIILVSIFPSALILITLGLTLAKLASDLTRELEQLSESCDALMLDGTSPGRARAHLFELDAPTSRETSALSNTLIELTNRLDSTLTAQARFIAEAAHELRTPLTAVRGELEVALRRERPAHEYAESITHALADVARLQTLTESLLDAARASEARVALTKVDVNVAITRVTDTLRARAEAEALSIVIKGCDSASIYADQLMTERVLTNLIENTIRHAGASTLELSCELRPHDELHILVEDDGRGLPANVQAHLFTPFVRQRRDGHGLGLFLSRKLMHQQGGELLLEKSDASGTQWRLVYSQRPPMTLA